MSDPESSDGDVKAHVTKRDKPAIETRLYKDGEKVLKTVVEKGVKRDKEFKVETFRYNDSRKTWEYKLILDGSAYSEDGKDWFQENDLDMA